MTAEQSRRTIFNVRQSLGPRTVGAATELRANLDAMTNHLASAVLTDGSDSLNRTFEAVKGVTAPAAISSKLLS